MDSFKERLGLLEKRTKNLEVNLCKSHETDTEIHVSSIDKEQGVIPINELDTFRFVRAENWLMPEFTKSDGTWKHGMVSNATLYFLTNPTQEIKELVEHSLHQKINFTNHIICFKYYGEKTTFESMITDKKLVDFYIFWYQGGPCYGRISILQTLYSALNSKPFEIEELPKQKSSKNPPYDFILSNFINGMNYKANLTIDFKNTYDLLPHVSFFLTPLDINTLKISLKSLTTKQAVFELSYGCGLVYTSTQFHWMVSGSTV
jgi:hypothetical protein